MTRFPGTEREIAALALLVGEGLLRAAGDFPDPPVSPDQIMKKLQACNAATAAAVAAETAARSLSILDTKTGGPGDVPGPPSQLPAKLRLPFTFWLEPLRPLA